MPTMADIQALADRIAEAFHPEKIILFGSYAYGQPTEDSDVDLLVIVRHGTKAWDKASEIRGAVRPKFPLDLLVRTPRQVSERLELGDLFLTDVVRHGRTLYEARGE
ncbi:MAG: nucleotidyltransferase domain-containing protein [Planctomycetes bacterium]|nr:nucleotidyltransferase domain-containing protein [Planctomycetota bacterium]